LSTTRPPRVGSERPRAETTPADRDDELTDPQPLGVAELGRPQVAGVDPKQSQVRHRIRADDLELELAAVDERRPTAVGPLDYMRRGEGEAVRRDHDGAAAAVQPAATPDAPRDPEVRYRRRQPLRNRGHGLGVSVEWLVLSSVVGRRDEGQLRHSAKLAMPCRPAA
jgi:hypothetical protein